MKKNYEKMPFLKASFYENHLTFPQLLCDLQRLKKSCFEEFEMYDSGEFLTWTVYPDKCHELLSTVISDIDAYRNAANEIYISSADPSVIEIALLNDHYTEVHGEENALYWSEFMQQFLTAQEHSFIHQTNH